MSFVVQIHINKTGGSSLRHSVPGQIHIEPHRTAQELQTFYGADGFRNALSFAFVRNPYSRVVSQYEYRRSKYGSVDEPGLIPPGVSFDEWVNAVYVERDPQSIFFHDQRWFMPCTWWLQDDSGICIVDKVYRFESFDTEVQRLRDAMKDRQLPGWSFKVPHLKKTTYRKPWQEYYTDETRDIVTRFFKSDIEAFGYGLRM